MPTSIVLESDFVDRLRVLGAARGLSHRTGLEVIVREHLDE